jgi:hypothetical protein
LIWVCVARWPAVSGFNWSGWRRGLETLTLIGLTGANQVDREPVGDDVAQGGTWTDTHQPTNTPQLQPQTGRAESAPEAFDISEAELTREVLAAERMRLLADRTMEPAPERRE